MHRITFSSLFLIYILKPPTTNLASCSDLGAILKGKLSWPYVMIGGGWKRRETLDMIFDAFYFMTYCFGKETYTLPTLDGVDHQWTESTNIGCNQWLSLAKIALKVPSAGRNHSLVANTSRCGEGILCNWIWTQLKKECNVFCGRG
jgi:hypothetical protein